MKEREKNKGKDYTRRDFLIALGVVGTALITGACTPEKLVEASWSSPTPVRRSPTEVPVQPTITFEPLPTLAPKPTETPVPEEKLYLYPAIVYPEEFPAETVAGFLARGENEYYRPIDKGAGREDYVKKVYHFLLVNSETLTPLLEKTEVEEGKNLAKVSQLSGKTTGEILEINKDNSIWREQVVGNLSSFRAFLGTNKPLELVVPWKGEPIGGGELSRSIKTKERKDLSVEEVKVGETAKGNPINLEILRQDNSQDWDGRPIILIMGGIHPGEKTGNEAGQGWLALTKKYFSENPEIWQGYRIAFLDPNFDGKGRVNPNGINIQRNFGGEECPSCLWDEKEINEGSLCSSSGRPGKGPNSEPESQAIIKAAEYLKQTGEVWFAANLHGADNSVESGACLDRGLNCEVTELLAEKMGVKYRVRWDKYTCGWLHGEPDEYLRRVFDIPTATVEFSQVQPLEKETARFCESLMSSVNEVYSLK